MTYSLNFKTMTLAHKQLLLVIISVRGDVS
jgi:hypothetical protein